MIVLYRLLSFGCLCMCGSHGFQVFLQVGRNQYDCYQYRPAKYVRIVPIYPDVVCFFTFKIQICNPFIQSAFCLAKGYSVLKGFCAILSWVFLLKPNRSFMRFLACLDIYIQSPPRCFLFFCPAAATNTIESSPMSSSFFLPMHFLYIFSLSSFICSASSWIFFQTGQSYNLHKHFFQVLLLGC